MFWLPAAQELQNKSYVVDTKLRDSHPTAVMIKSIATP